MIEEREMIMTIWLTKLKVKIIYQSFIKQIVILPNIAPSPAIQILKLYVLLHPIKDRTCLFFIGSVRMSLRINSIFLIWLLDHLACPEDTIKKFLQNAWVSLTVIYTKQKS
jgi:hypothetical protein